jgi:pyruvate/2-oxoglutarate dehydrogenase complex dihydrolipoamide acyltransferase (E2) component
LKHQLQLPNVKPAQEVPYIPTAIIAKVAGNNKFYSPLVLNIANSEGIGLSELEYIVGTGADGRVSKRDVLQYVADKRAGKVTSSVTESQWLQHQHQWLKQLQHNHSQIKMYSKKQHTNSCTSNAYNYL